MKKNRIKVFKQYRLSLGMAAVLLISACGGSSQSATGHDDPAAGSSDNVEDSTTQHTASQIAAAQQAATTDPDCQAIAPFYFEIGNGSGPITSGTVGGSTYKASTQINIASASKWLFGAYVAEARAGILSATDLEATRMQSGYVSMGNICGENMTVESCFTFGANDTYTPSSRGRFHYGSGHHQNWGVNNGLASLTGPQVASAYRAALGIDLDVGFNGPLLAGGAIMSSEDYAVFLRKILNGQLQMARMLGEHKICTLPGACSTADYSPTAKAWSYSIGHWVEDDPVSGDGAFSSAGTFGFYPWIDRNKTYYGILSRMDMNGNAGAASAQCGYNIRKAFMTAARSA